MIKTKSKVILDTNLFISALVFRSETILKAFSLAYANCEVCFSDNLISEIKSKLSSKFHFTDFQLLEFEEYVTNGTICSPHQQVCDVRDPKDNFLLQLAQESKSDYLITGDKDLLVLEKWQACEILTASDFLARFGMNEKLKTKNK